MSNKSEIQIPEQNDETDESGCTNCELDRLPPEMTRFIFRKLSTEDLLQASATTDRLYRVAQHHLYLSDGALLVRSGKDTAATVVESFDIRHVSSLYLADVYDFERDVPGQLYRRQPNNVANGDTVDVSGRTLDVLHVGYVRDVTYADMVANGLRHLLSGVRARQVCFNNVQMTADDVADVVSALLEAAANRGWDDGSPTVLRCSYDRADDVQVLALMDEVECTCAGLLAEFRVTVRRPAPRAYAIFPMSSATAAAVAAISDNDAGAVAATVVTELPVATELPENLLTLTVTDCSGLRPSAYRRLGAECRRLRRLYMRAARQADDDGFDAVTGMPSLRHLEIDGLSNVTSDGLLNGLDRAHGLQSLGLAGCTYVTDDVLHRVGNLRRLRRLRLDLTECDKTTAAGVLDMLTGCRRVRELDLTLPLNADYVEAVATAASLNSIRLFRLTFERLSFQEHLNNQPSDSGWQQLLVTRFRAANIDFHVRQTFTKILVSVD